MIRTLIERIFLTMLNIFFPPLAVWWVTGPGMDVYGLQLSPLEEIYAKCYQIDELPTIPSRRHTISHSWLLHQLDIFLQETQGITRSRFGLTRPQVDFHPGQERQIPRRTQALYLQPKGRQRWTIQCRGQRTMEEERVWNR